MVSTLPCLSHILTENRFLLPFCASSTCRTVSEPAPSIAVTDLDQHSLWCPGTHTSPSLAHIDLWQAHILLPSTTPPKVRTPLRLGHILIFSSTLTCLLVSHTRYVTFPDCDTY
jgi:hypothetical protein